MTAPPMTRGEWQRVKRVAADAWTRPAHERARYAAEVCRGDETLHHEVLSLLASMDQVGDWFETPPLALPVSRLVAAALFDAAMRGLDALETTPRSAMRSSQATRVRAMLDRI